MRILAIGAHPDDIDLLCGGTLLRLADEGHEIVVAIATKGDVGSPTLTRDEIAAVRFEEAAAACRILGAELIWLGYDDEWLFNDRPTRTAFIDAIRQARPDVIFAHSPSDYHPDHRAAGQLTLDARIPSAVRLVETARPALATVPKVYLMDTLGQQDFAPDLFVDISEVVERKDALIRAHASQDEWLRHLYDMDYIESMRSGERDRGSVVGVEFAEAFAELRTFPAVLPEFALPGEIRPA